MNESTTAAPPAGEIPVGDLAGLRRYAASDALSGFLVFLIALPLCLGIALASGFPPVAGVFTAILGGLVAPFLSNSELAIKGPAAGLIVIVAGVVADFGGNGFDDGQWTSLDQNAYRLTLGVGVAAAVLQVLFGVLRGGILGELFPTSAVHGLLAAIGVIIISKQLPMALGVSAKGKPLELLYHLPQTVMAANPEIALIGLTSLVILVGWSFVTKPALKRIPGQVIVLAVAVPLGYFLGLDDPSPHKYEAFGHLYEVSDKYLVNVPTSLFSAMTTPDFAGVFTKTGLYWAGMLAIIGTLESLLSVKAVELLDPHRRSTNLDRDNTSVGVGNLLAAMVGGLPMISEIVRSRANLDSGAKTRFSNFFHGAFLLLFLAFVPGLIRAIPLAALAAMLVFTGFRLAHPREFAKVKKIGTEQLVVYAGTTLAVLATDLLVGILIGVLIEVLVLLAMGMPLSHLFRTKIEAMEDEGSILVRLKTAVAFSNWLGLRRALERLRSESEKSLTVDLRDAKIVDHTVMAKLEHLQREFAKEGRSFAYIGLEDHAPVSAHPMAARRSVPPVAS